jgi:hypothetical protein
MNIKISIGCNEKWDNFFLDPKLDKAEFLKRVHRAFKNKLGMQITLATGEELVLPIGVLENNLIVIKGD